MYEKVIFKILEYSFFICVLALFLTDNFKTYIADNVIRLTQSTHPDQLIVIATMIGIFLVVTSINKLMQTLRKEN